MHVLAQPLFEKSFRDELNRRLASWPQLLREEAIDKAIQFVADRIGSGEFVPDPRKSLVAYVARKAVWFCKSKIGGPKHSSAMLGQVAASSASPSAADHRAAVFVAAMTKLTPRERHAFFSNPSAPWLVTVERFLDRSPRPDEAAAARFAGFLTMESFTMAKSHASEKLGPEVERLLANPIDFGFALKAALHAAESELVNDPHSLSESPLSSLGAQFAAAAIEMCDTNAVRPRSGGATPAMPNPFAIIPPAAFSISVALRLDVSNLSDLSLTILETILPFATGHLEAQALVAHMVATDHAAAHLEGERRFSAARELLEQGIRSATAFLEDVEAIDASHLWWVRYQKRLIQRRSIEVSHLAAPGSAPSESVDRQAALVEVLGEFELLLQSATDVGQRLAVAHQIAVVESLLGELLLPSDTAAAKRLLHSAQSRIQAARWQAIAFGESSSRRFAYGYRRRANNLWHLARVEHNPDRQKELLVQSQDELNNALELAKQHQFNRFAAIVTQDLQRLFPS